MREDDFYQTPPELFAALDAEFHFDLDAAANSENHLCEKYLSEDSVGGALSVDWANYGTSIYCNPPYSKEGMKDQFIRKAWEAAGMGATVVMLLPAKVNTNAFHFFIWDEKKHRPYDNVQIRFPKGRPKFLFEGKRQKSGGRFEVMIVIFYPRNER